MQEKDLLELLQEVGLLKGKIYFTKIDGNVMTTEIYLPKYLPLPWFIARFFPIKGKHLCTIIQEKGTEEIITYSKDGQANSIRW